MPLLEQSALRRAAARSADAHRRAVGADGRRDARRADSGAARDAGESGAGAAVRVAARSPLRGCRARGFAAAGSPRPRFLDGRGFRSRAVRRAELRGFRKREPNGERPCSERERARTCSREAANRRTYPSSASRRVTRPVELLDHRAHGVGLAQIDAGAREQVHRVVAAAGAQQIEIALARPSAAPAASSLLHLAHQLRGRREARGVLIDVVRRLEEVRNPRPRDLRARSSGDSASPQYSSSSRA